MASLHLVNRAASSSDALQRCLSLSLPGDVVLLIEDGVYGALPEVFATLDRDPAVTVQALLADVEARGLHGRLANQIDVIDYAGFVELTERNNPVVSWS